MRSFQQVKESLPVHDADEVGKLRRRLERERKARLDAEAIAEQGLRDLYAKRRQLELLEQVAVAANESSSLEAVVRSALATVCAYTGWSVGQAFVTVETDNGLRLASMNSYHSNGTRPLEAFRKTSEEILFACGKGLPGRVLSSKAPAWIGSIAKDSNFLRADAAKAAGLNAAFAFPVLAAGHKVAAVLEFFSEEAQECDDVLLQLMAQVGNQVGRVFDRKRAEEQLVHNALHDVLTQLPNRAQLLQRLEAALTQRKSSPNDELAVLFIDLDGFKVVNDSLGHHAGDALIIAFAERVSAALAQHTLANSPKERAMLARLGGDEFVVLLQGAINQSDAVDVADLILDLLKDPFVVHAQDLYASASIGILADCSDAAAPGDILRNADLALYRAKAQGKSCHVVFDSNMHVEAMKRLKLEADLRASLRRDEFVVHFQPIVALSNTRIVGFEALVRWLRDGRELVQPGEFINVAEDTGLILPLGTWILENACQAMVRMHADMPQSHRPYVAVNLSARQFAQPDLVARIKEIITRTGISPTCVRLEVTESVAMVDGARALRILTELREFGVSLAIDDFGTGYSSLSSLHDYPLELLKIDRSFVSRMREGPESMQIVQTIINLARNLHMKVVAEGVETQADLALLRTMGCDLGQGYLFSRPVGETEARGLLGIPAVGLDQDRLIA